MLTNAHSQRRADSPPSAASSGSVSSRVFLGRLLSSSADLRFLCYAHPQQEINRWLLFFGQRQLSPNYTVSSHDAGQTLPPKGTEEWKKRIKQVASPWEGRMNRLFRIARELMKKDGLHFENQAHPHRFRHTFASRLLRKGTSTRVVAQFWATRSKLSSIITANSA
jgi:hypothetical protein